MSDIQKLHKVIESLEEQSSRVGEFNGVLSAVNSAKAEISGAKEAFAALGDEQHKLVSESYTKFDEFGTKLAALEKRLTALESKIVSAEQFESGRDKILLRMSELRFVTPEQFEKDIEASEKNTAFRLAENNINTQQLLEAQMSSLKSLKTLTVIGILALAGGIAFLAKDAFM